MVRFILLAILLIVIARMFWRVVDVVIDSVRTPGEGRRRSSPAVKLVRDPVCGTHVQPRSELSVASGGTTYYFCSDECRRKFGRQ